MEIISIFTGPAWKLQNLVKNFEDFRRYTAPAFRLQVETGEATLPADPDTNDFES